MEKNIQESILTSQSNTVLGMHTFLSALPIIFRECVCEECNWSTPTFYRKIRTKDTVDPGNKKRVISAISNAEKETIKKIIKKLHALLEQRLEPYAVQEISNNK